MSVKITVDDLAQEIRRVDGNHSLGAGALAEALFPFFSAHTAEKGEAEPVGLVFELAKARNRETGEYCDWGRLQFSFVAPSVPEGAIRNFEAVYAHPPAPRDDLVAEVERLRAALEFYAEKKNWLGSGWHPASPTKPPGTLERTPSAIETDAGKTARAALEGRTDA